MDRRNIIIGTLILLLGITFYFGFINYREVFKIDNKGYLFSSKLIVDKLNTPDLKESDSLISFELTNENEPVYKKGFKYYIGNEDKKEVNLNLPSISEDGSRVTNLTNTGFLITKEFKVFPSFDNSILTDGILYNGASLDRVDNENYIFIKTDSNIFVNSPKLKIEINGDDVTIQENSIINFLENEIRYYYLEDGQFKYKRIGGISLDDYMKYFDEKIVYKDFLINLDVIGNLKFDDEILPDIKEEIRPPYKKPAPIIDDTVEEYVYIKPAVSGGIKSVGVYSMMVDLNIEDPARRIETSPTVEVKLNDRIYVKKVFYSNGNFDIMGLLPETDFEILGYYTYRDESGKLRKYTFINETIKTNDTSNIEDINLFYENNEIFPDKIQFDNLSLKNKKNDEVLKGIKRVEVHVGNKTYDLPNSIVNSLKSLETEEYKTPTTLNSNTSYDVEFEFYDAADNKLIVTNSETRVKTSKQIPSVDIEITDTDLTYFKANIKFENEDDVYLDNIKYVITDNKNNIIVSDKLLSNELFVQDLDVNNIYNLSLFVDYDIEDGKGIVKNNKLRTVKISTKPISTLGFVRLVMNEKNILQNSANYSLEINSSSNDDKLIELLTEIKIIIKNKETKDIVFEEKISGDDITNIKNYLPYDLLIRNLTSKTDYEMDYEAIVRQGTKEFTVKGLSNIKEFSTLKQEAKVEITNKYTSENLIDFDVRIQDVDGAILSNRAILEIRDSSESLIGFEHFDINGEYRRLTFDKLEKDENYTFKYLAEEYNVGYNNSTYIQDNIILKETINTSRGVFGEIQLDSVLKEITSSNIFDITDSQRWRKEGYSSIDEKIIDSKNNIIKMAAKNGYASYSYYLPEGKGQELEISFKIRHTADSNMQSIYLSNGGFSNKQNELRNLSTEWKEFRFSIGLNSNNYIGFYINEISNNNTITTVEVKDLYIGKQNYNTNPTINESIVAPEFIFRDTIMYRGNEEMPSIDGNKMKYNTLSNGYAKITNIDTKEEYTFDFIENEEEFTVPKDGAYKFELWGAAGGGDLYGRSSRAGRGGYSSGTITLKAFTNLYVNVGGVGKYGSGANAFGGPIGGYNGGGNGGNKSSGSGGGATDIRYISSKNTDIIESLASRIIVAGGGGGSDDAYGSLGGYNDGSGGDGGGISSLGPTINGKRYNSYAAYQAPINGTEFGFGGNVTLSTDTGGGGAGYYGGAVTNNNDGGGAGGSSYISGHLGCIAYKNLLSDNENIDINYSEKSTYKARLYANLDDTKDELVNKEFYIQVIRDEIVENVIPYDMNDSTNIENVLIEYDTQKNTNYEFKLVVKVRDRFYPVDSVYFTTEEEIRSIKTVDEFFKIHIRGKYIVLNDLDFRQVYQNYGSMFSGKIDFQGKNIYLDVLGSKNELFYQVNYSALFENLNVHYYLNNETTRSSYFGLFNQFRGTLRNLKVTVEESNDILNSYICLIANDNYGTVESFVINNKAGFSTARYSALGFIHNYGTVKNGYLYGQPINASYPTTTPKESKRVGALAGYTSSRSNIENVFSLIGINGVDPLATEVPTLEDRIGSLVGESVRGKITNSYSITSGDNRTLTRDANIGINGYVSSKNLFYISDDIYNPAYSLKLPKSILRDNDFHETLNVDKKFIIDEYVDFGFFPQLNWPDSMPNQEYIKLPEVNDADLVDIISVKEVTSENNYSLVTLVVNNPSSEEITNIGIKDMKTVEILEQKNISNGKSEVKIKLSDPIRYLSKYYLKSITSVNNFGRDYTREYEDNERCLLIDMYRVVSSIEEFKDVKTYPTENFLLTTDLDFKNTPSTYFQINSYTGTLNGNGHTIKNIVIPSNQGFINELRGTVKNLFVEDVERLAVSPHDRFGFIGYLYFGARVNNVHVKNIKLYSNNRMGGLVAYSSGGIIENSSVTNPSVVELSNVIDIEIGGLVGEMRETSIDNCFVQDIDFNIMHNEPTHAVGGLVGYVNSGIISNAYTTGNIKTRFENTGGVVGHNNGVINGVYSNTSLTSLSDYVGGIVGLANSEAISNSLFVGTLYSNQVDNHIKRIASNRTVVNNNYAWNDQHINGQISGVTSGESLLTRDQLSKKLTYDEIINLSDNYNYDDIGVGKLPKLYSTDYNTVLPNQKDNYLKVYDFEIVNIEIKKAVADAYIQLELNNPNHYELKDFKVDGMSIDVKKNVNLGNSTYIEFLGVPDKAYDSYKLYEFTYVENGKDILFETDVKITTQFYKDLEKFEDWQKISHDDAENYRLVADIDFEGKKNINYNVVFNRLEGTGDTKKILKNIDLTFGGSDNALIKTMYSNITNIEFKNVEITNTNYSDRSGLLLFVYGKVSKLDFTDVKLNMENSSYVGMISFDRSLDLRDINLSNIYVRGRHVTSGFLAKSNVNGITNITFDNLDIKNSGSYTGGVIAHSDYVSPTRVYNVTGSNSKIEGLNYTGGVFGHSGGRNIDVTNMEVIGNGNHTGGIAGHFSIYDCYYMKITDSTVSGVSGDIGGVNGTGHVVSSAYVDNVDVTGLTTDSYSVGGISGGGGYTVNNSIVRNSRIISKGSSVGGIRGSFSWSTMQNNYVLDTIVEGGKYVGGIVGTAGDSSSIHNTMNNATVKATEMAAGGLIGFANNPKDYEEDTSNRISASSNIVANTSVTAPLLSGALIGRLQMAFYPNQFNSNFISANVFNTNTESTDAIIGSSDYYVSGLNNTRIYDNTTLNGIKINAENGLNEADFVTSSKLADIQTYKDVNFNTYYYDYSKLEEGYFPFLYRINEDYVYPFPLPTAPEIQGLAARYMMARMSMNPNYFHPLPEYNLYVSDVDKINIEFNDIDTLTTLKVNGISNKIKSKVYTYQYNFKDDIEITIDDGVNKETKIYKAKDLINTVYTNKDKYYLIKDKKLITNDKEIKDTEGVLNIFNNKLLLSNSKVVDLNTNELKYMVYNKIRKLDYAQELYNFDFNGLNIDTFYNYSFVESNEMDNQLFVKNNKIEMLQGGCNSLLESIIVDNYNDKNFLTILSKEGYIYNLKDKITFPDKFDNFNIKKMSNNLVNDSNLVAVEYDNNDFIVFDYRNGEVYYKNYKNNSNILEYFKQSFVAQTIEKEETQKLSNYKKTQNLINEIAFDNIITSDKTGGVYIPVYKASKNTYDIYDITSLTKKDVDSLSDVNNSVTDQINNNVDYKDHYIDNKVEKRKSTSSLLIFFMILIGVILSILMLGNNIRFKKHA